jgi:two-component system chemotaxis sensor kinase CheA
MRKELNVDALRSVFLQEAEEGLAAMEQALLALEARPGDPEPLNEVFRFAHTIKGGAAMVEYATLADLAHRFEDALSMMRDGLVPVTPARITLMLQIVDSLRSTLAVQANGRSSRVRAADVALIGRLIPVEFRHEEEPALDGDHEPAAASEPGRATTARRGLRVDMTKLDALLTLSGEIAVAKGRVMQVLATEHASEAGTTAAEELNRLLASLHECVMEMRLVPVGPLFRQHQRTVRDIAANQGKLLRLVLSGEDVAVDATVVEQLRDPLTHIIRNAVDHGIEYAASRRDAGKDPCGTVELHARHERGIVVVEIRDDGHGISRERILKKAVERGLVKEDDQLTDAQVFALTMAPGLSTAERVTELSGRGVGMDVVRRSIEALRGTIEIDSKEGKGTVVRLRLPLTVAIIDGFAVGVRDERYVIPVGAVTECLTATETEPGVASGVLSMRGTAVPYVRLRHLLGAGRGEDAVGRESVVIVEYDGRRMGLVVDELLGETQAVITPLARMFNGVRGVSGTTIMSDGRVSLILDVGPLMDLAHGRSPVHQFQGVANV